MAAPALDTLYDVVKAVLELERPKPSDAAVAALALAYATEIDGDGDLAKLGPSLLGALEALHLSPRARAIAERGVKPHVKSAASPLDELRKRRAGKNPAAAPHATPA